MKVGSCVVWSGGGRYRSGGEVDGVSHVEGRGGTAPWLEPSASKQQCAISNHEYFCRFGGCRHLGRVRMGERQPRRQRHVPSYRVRQSHRGVQGDCASLTETSDDDVGGRNAVSYRFVKDGFYPRERML